MLHNLLMDFNKRLIIHTTSSKEKLIKEVLPKYPELLLVGQVNGMNISFSSITTLTEYIRDAKNDEHIRNYFKKVDEVIKNCEILNEKEN